MILFADILLAALTLVSPRNGETVETLRPVHRDYLAAERKVRFARLDDAAYRQKLVAEGYVQMPLKLVWQGATEPAKLTVDYAEGGMSQTFAVTNGCYAYITNLEVGRTYRWRVSANGETAEATFTTDAQPPRLLRVEGVVNVRDLGGWKGLGGRRVRQGLIIRSAGLRGSAVKKDDSIFSNRYDDGGQTVTAAGIAELRDDLKIKTDIDVRSATETVFMRSSVLGPDVRWIKEPFSAYNFIDSMVRGREPFMRLFVAFTEKENYPILFHCSGGRDRTGTLAFLLLGLLGVSDDDLCRDWETSAFCENSAEFASGRIGRLLTYLETLGGDTMAERCERFAKSCGITDQQIAAFRAIMLEEKNAEGGAK